jgi:predicted regulator of Ras-like GTPase activity (Roadblock/LC7/MglB family)
MKDDQLRAELESIARKPGLQGCALVDTETGMIWSATGAHADIQKIAEAASDYWRLYLRHRRHIDSLGDLHAQILIHTAGRITITSCGNSALLVTLSGAKDTVDWKAWQVDLHHLKNLLHQR